MKTETFSVLTNHRVLLVARNGENLKNNSENNSSAANYVEFSSKFVLFS